MSPEQKQPDKAFFETDQRAALLRNVCLQAIDASRAMTEDPDNDTALQVLLDTNSQLASLGVEPSMHVIKAGDPDEQAKQREIISNPVKAAEFLAGQVRSLVIKTNGLTETVTGLHEQLAEHDELLGEGEDAGAYLVRFDVMPVNAAAIGTIGLLSSMIDYDAGPSELSR